MAKDTALVLFQKNCKIAFILHYFRVFAAITFGGQALGRASALTPDVGKAKMAAAKLFELFDRVPAVDSSDPGGEKPVSVLPDSW